MIKMTKSGEKIDKKTRNSSLLRSNTEFGTEKWSSQLVLGQIHLYSIVLTIKKKSFTVAFVLLV